MWRGNSVSVVLPTYNEKDSIRSVIRGFEAIGVVDEIIVVNNNAAAGTSEEVAPTSAREVVETRQGYGAAIRRGLAEATGGLVCVCEPDGTFDPDDLLKLLAYSEDSPFVVGSRTVSTFIWDGANMGWFLQFGNWTVAKLIEVLFNTTSLSDVGCTFRVLNRDLVGKIDDQFKEFGSAFGLEMLLLAIGMHVRVVQIPVNYRPRVGRIIGDRGFPEDAEARQQDDQHGVGRQAAQRRSMPVRYRRSSPRHTDRKTSMQSWRRELIDGRRQCARRGWRRRKLIWRCPPDPRTSAQH